MRMLAMLCGAAVVLAGAANRVEAQWGYGTLRYGTAVSSVRGPLGGRVTVAQGPFGGGAVSVRGPFGGRVNVVRSGIVPVVPPLVRVPYALPPAVGVPYFPPPPVVVQQTVLNPALTPNFTYSAAYRARIPPGYATLEIAATPYYYSPVLPPGSQAVVLGGANYYVNNGVLYQPYFLGGQTVYVVVER